MNDLKIFDNEEFGAVRILMRNGEPMFALADVCKAININNSRDVKSRLKDDGVDTIDIVDSRGRKNTATFINESNLYRCIFQSRSKKAEAFQDWVFEEVIPSIRRTGSYSAPVVDDETQFRKELDFADMTAQILRLSEVSKLGMMQKIGARHNCEYMLPQYVKCEEVPQSATALLASNNIPMTSRKLNAILLAHGYIERLTHGDKSYPSITEKGLEYGENYQSPEAHGTSQPLWYPSRFMELMQIIGVN